MEIGFPPEKMDEVAQPEQTILMTMPHPRFNAQLAVQDDVLFIFGGTYEHGDREFTFDEMYSVDLGKLDGVKEIYRRELENWHGSEDEESDSQEEYDNSEDDDKEEGPKGVHLPRDEPNVESIAVIDHVADDMEEEENEPSEKTLDDTRPHPRAFESLREFFTRTSQEWQQLLLDTLRKQNSSSMKSIKEVRKDAFEMAETKWWDCREEITALEDQQEEAGIGEIVSANDRGSEAIGAGRRR